MEEKIKDLYLIQNMVQELGLSPLDIFMNWVENGRVKNLALKVTYDNGEVAELDLSTLHVTTNFNVASRTDPPNQPVAEEKRTENPKLPEVEEKPEVPAPVAEPASITDPAPATEPESEENGQSESEKKVHKTSIKHGRIQLQEEQRRNVKVGAYVYTTGDVLPTTQMLAHVNVRGIVLSYSSECITIINYIGSNQTAVQAAAQTKNGWRFLNYKECKKIANYQETISVSQLGIKRKQLDDSLMLLYKDDSGELYAYNIATRQVHKSLNDKTVIGDRGFAVFLAKDLTVIK